ncbi:hypothetical protein Nmel_008482 [Mimus melanotis]
MEEEWPAAEPAQADPVSVSASRSRDADAGTGHQQKASQQEQAGLSVHIECHQSPLWHGPVLKEVIMSFKRRPSEELDRSFQAHGSLQQQHGLEEREPQRQGQGSSLRHSGALNVTPGQVPLEQLGAQAASSEPVAWTKEQECEDAIGPELSERAEWEDALDVQLSEEEVWANAVDTELCQGTDDIGSPLVLRWVSSLGLQDNKGSPPALKEGLSCPTDEGRIASGRPEGSQDMECPLDEEDEGEDREGRATVTQTAQEEPSVVGEQGAAGPDQGQAFTYTIPFSTFLDALGEESQMWCRKALSILQKALNAAQGKGEQKRQRSTGSKEVLPEPTQSIRAEGLDKGHPVKQGPGQQLVEAEPDLELCTKEATEAGKPAGPVFRSPSPTVIDALARERRTSIFESAPWALPRAFSPMHRRGEQEQQQPTAYAQDMPDTAWCSEILSKTTAVIQGLKQTEEQEYVEHSRDATTLALRARAAGAVSPAHAPYSPTADGLDLLDTALDTRDEFLSKAVIVIQGSEEHMEEQGDLEQSTGGGMRVTAPAEGTERPVHTVHSCTASVPVFLEHNDYIRTEVVKKAMKPFQYPEEEQDQELSTEESTGAEGPADRAQSLPAPAVIITLAQLRLLMHVWQAQEVWRVLRALHLAAAATSDTGKEEKEKQPTADATDVLHTTEHMRTEVQDRAALGMHASSQQNVEQ